MTATASAIALAVGAMPAYGKVAADPPKTELETLLADQKAAVDRLGSEWAVAEGAAHAASKRVAEFEKLLARHQEIKKRQNASYNPSDDPFVRVAQQRLDKERQEADKLRKEADSRQEWYQLASSQLPGHETQIVPARGAPTQGSYRTTPPQPGACSIDRLEDRRRLDPDKCSRHVQGATQFGIGGRVLDRRGVTIQLSASGDSTEATLQLADKVNYRRIIKEEDGSITQQHPWQLGYKVGLKSANSGRLFGLGERDPNRRIGDLDRLDEKLTLFGGLSFGFFPHEKVGDFDKRAEEMFIAARDACWAEQGKAPDHPSICTGEALLEWIFQSDNGVYAHKDHIEKFNAVYWGSSQKVPTWGGGYQGEFGLPTFQYYPFTLTQVPNPFGGGQPANVVDLANLPPSFLAGDATSERHLTWAHTLYGFYHRPARKESQWNMGTTFILSGTYKRSYEFPTGTKDVTICPPDPPGAPAFTSELCQKVNIADVDRLEDFVGGFEVRQQFRGIPAIPAFGIMPKFTHEFDRGRNAFDMPIYFTFDDKGLLNGGIRLAHEWGGVTASGADRKSKSEVSIFFGTTFDLSPNK